jgi:hypothetical protein
MDVGDTASRLAEERRILHHVGNALRSELRAPLDERSASMRRQHFHFLGEVLRRHAARAFGLAEHGESLQFACDWQGDGASDSSLRTRHGELKRDLDDILAEASRLDAEDLAGQAAGRQRLIVFLDRLESYLSDETVLCDRSRILANIDG